MSPRITCLWGCKVTLVAFVWFFSTMRFQMCPQIACLRRGKVTLNAFVWRFSTVRFQMSSQIASIRWGIVTLVAFVWLFSTVRFQMSSQIAFVCLFTNCGFWNTCSMSWPEKMQFHTGCICLIFHNSVFSNVSSNYMPLSFFKCLSKFLLKFSFWNACNCFICDLRFRFLTQSRNHMKVNHSEMLLIVVYVTWNSDLWPIVGSTWR